MKNKIKKLKNSFLEIIKELSIVQILINAIAIYIVCHMILHIF